MVIGNDHNVYVTGTAKSGYNITVTASYSPIGERRWLVSYNFDSQGSRIDRDDNGYYYVSCNGVYGNIRKATILKYDAAGNLIWVFIYTNPQGGSGRAADIVVDGQTGISYVSGLIYWGTNPNEDALTFAVNTNANLLWDRIYGGIRDDAGIELAISRVCVYVAGYTNYYPGDFLTLCYQRSNGVLKWARTYDWGGDDCALAIAIKPLFTNTTYIACAGRRQDPSALTALMYSYNEVIFDTLVANDTIGGPQGNEKESADAIKIEKPYPNPAGERVNIGFVLDSPQKVYLKLFDASGRYITSVFEGEAQAGRNEIIYQPERLTNGIYLIQLQTAHCSKIEKIVLRH